MLIRCGIYANALHKYFEKWAVDHNAVYNIYRHLNLEPIAVHHNYSVFEKLKYYSTIYYKTCITVHDSRHLHIICSS